MIFNTTIDIFELQAAHEGHDLRLDSLKKEDKIVLDCVTCTEQIAVFYVVNGV